MKSEHEIRPKYEELVTRFENETNPAIKVKMKHKFIAWITEHHSELSSAELEYLQAGICSVEDIYY